MLSKTYELMHMRHNLGVSVVICCYNSKDRLPDTLRHLSLQNVSPTLQWEIIVIDNGSKDDIYEVAKLSWKRLQSDISFRIFNQSIPGKTAALKLGYKSAKYEYIIICDDDNWLNVDYVQRAFDLMNADETVAALGGKGIAVCEHLLPEWFDKFSLSYAVGHQMTNEVPIEKRSLYGAGMVLRGSILEKVSKLGLDYELTYLRSNGTEKVIAGEDEEICFILSLMNYRILYDDSLQFRHNISQNRLNLDYLGRLCKGYGVTLPLLSPYKELLKSKRKGRKINIYFWVFELFSALIITARSSILLSINIFFKRINIENKMEFFMNSYLVFNYLKRNFTLSKKIIELQDKFKVN